MAGPVVISILANASQANRSLKSVSGAASSMGASVKRAGRVAALGVVAAVAGAVKLGSSLVAAGERAGTSNARIKQVATSMGLFGNETDKVSNRLVKLAEKQARATGVDQNAIKATQAKLLTFKELGKSADQAGGNFDRATAAAVDLAATGFGTAETNAAQLGKALNDPIKGLTALTKSGVTFTEAEKARIKTLVESGKVGKAQNKVLSAIETQVGGTAKATANGTDRMKVAVSQLAEKLGGALTPIVDKAATFLVDRFLPAAKDLADSLGDRLSPIVGKIRDAFAKLVDKLAPVGEFFRSNPELIKGAGIALGIAAAAAVAFGVGMALIAVATSPITLVILAIAALGAGLAYAYKHSETFRNAVQNVGAKLQQFAGYVMSTVVPAVTAFARKVAGNLKPILDQVGQTIKTKIVPTLAKVIAKFREWWPTIKRVIEVVAKVIGKLLELYAKVAGKVIPILIRFAGFIFSKVIPAIVNFIGSVAKIIGKIIEFGKKVVDAVKKVGQFVAGVKRKFDEVVSFVSGIPGRILGALGDLGGLLKNAGTAIIQGLLDGINSMIDKVRGALSKVTDLIPDWKGPREKDKVLLRPAGRLIMTGLINGFADGTPGVKKSLEAVTKLITKTIGKRVKDEKKARAAIAARLKSLRDEYAALTKNAKAQDRVGAALDKAREKATSVRKAYTDTVASIRDQVVSAASITSLGEGAGYSSIDQMLDVLRGKVAQSEAYTKMIERLRKAGLNKTTLDQLIAAGAEAGTGAANTLLSGGEAAIRQYNALQTRLAASGTALGTGAAGALYNAGIKAADALVRQIERQQNRLDRAAERMGKRLVDVVRRDLGLSKRQSAPKPAQRSASKAYDDAAARRRDQDRKPISIKLSAEQVDQLVRGKRIQADLDAYRRAGGRATV